VGKKRLIRSPLDGLILVLPFVLWSLAIIIVYPISYAGLAELDVPVATINSVKYLEFYNNDLIFWAHELASQTTDADKIAILPFLQTSILQYRAEFEAIIFGPSGNQTQLSHFSHVRSITFRTPTDQALLYRTSDCLRGSEATDFQGSCYQTGHVYYEVTRSGMAAMIARSLEEATVMTHDSFSDMNLQSKRLDYIWRVGLQDLGNALFTTSVNAKNYALELLNKVLVANIVLLALSIILAFIFIWFQVLPYTRDAKKESKRVAELLSQLPSDM
jgi:hypothetical protein